MNCAEQALFNDGPDPGLQGFGLSFSRIPLSLQDGFFQGRMTAP